MIQASLKKPFGQGDVIFVPVERRPEGLTEVPRENGRLIVTHSETGHHHAIDGDDAHLFSSPSDPLTGHLSVAGEGVELIHHRSIDTHESIFFPPGEWCVLKQREHGPEGWRRVQD